MPFDIYFLISLFVFFFFVEGERKLVQYHLSRLNWRVLFIFGAFRNRREARGKANIVIR